MKTVRRLSFKSLACLLAVTVTLAARHFHVWPAVISRLERGLRRDDDLAQQYRTWLAAA